MQTGYLAELAEEGLYKIKYRLKIFRRLNGNGVKQYVGKAALRATPDELQIILMAFADAGLDATARDDGHGRIAQVSDMPERE